MKKKIFILIYTLGIVGVVTALAAVVYSVMQTPTVPVTPEQKADISLGQYGDRANANTTSSNTTTGGSPIRLPSFISGAPPLPPGCALTFSFAPITKAVDPAGTIQYAITISNRGKQTCVNVSLSVYYADSEKFVASDPLPTASDYYWAIGNLASTKTYKIALTTKNTAENGSKVMSEGCATADNSQDVCSDNVIFVAQGASVAPALANTFSVKAPSGGIWGKAFDVKEFGVWVWDTPSSMSSAYASNVIATAAKNGFNVIYLSIDDYIPIAQMEDQSLLQTKKYAYMQNLSYIIQAANKAGIAIDVEGGAKDWAEQDNRWKGYALIEFVKEYNERYPYAKIRGLQYDVEPYLLSTYDGDKEDVLNDYLAFIDESTRRMASVQAQFSIVIPHFYDSVQNWTPLLTYQGKTGYAFTQLLRILENKKGSTIIVMAYRNFFDGDNGTKQVAEAEVQEATKGGYGSKIIIAQETGDVTPDYVTFYNQPKDALYNSLSTISNYFDQYKAFNGVAVHYFDSFLKLQ